MTTPSIQSILAPVADDMAQLDQVIATQLASEVKLIQEISQYIIQAGGKRLRPALLLLFAKALGYQGTHHHLLAAVVECIHTATLLHDDVVDESILRRGRQTANAIFGNAASVLVGDFLYSRAFQMMLLTGQLRVMSIFAETTNTIAEGEVLQLLNMHNAQVSQADYFQVIRFKTAKLFEGAAQLGAVLAEANSEIEQAAAQYGQHLGIAFQLIDDLLDYAAETAQMGKQAGDDLREGKPTLPLIFLLEQGTVEQQALIRQALEQGETADFEHIRAVVQSSGALAYTQACAQREVDHAIAAISGLPPSPFQRSLIELCAFAVQRRF